MLTLGKTKRVHMERAVERYADGADAVIRDAQREKKSEEGVDEVVEKLILNNFYARV